MDRAIRILAALPGVLFLLQALTWTFAPAQAAEGLGMTLLEGTARSTQIGDLASFFYTASFVIVGGVWYERPSWLRIGALLIGGAAVMRTLAWALHDATFMAPVIAFEVAIAALLVFAASRMPAEGSSRTPTQN